MLLFIQIIFYYVLFSLSYPYSHGYYSCLQIFIVLQAIFMIPTKPPPSFRDPNKWSPEFIDFVSKCLVKNPEQRATAKELLEVC